MFTHRVPALTRPAEDQEGEAMKSFEAWVFGTVVLVALCLRKKVRRDVEVIVAKPKASNIEANWFPTADGLKSEMWH
jgi:hypothetical protein